MLTYLRLLLFNTFQKITSDSESEVGKVEKRGRPKVSAVKSRCDIKPNKTY